MNQNRFEVGVGNFVDPLVVPIHGLSSSIKVASAVFILLRGQLRRRLVVIWIQ